MLLRAGQDFQCIGNLERRHDGGNGVQNTRGFACELRARRRFGIDTTKACAQLRQYRHGDAVAAHGGSINPRCPPADGIIVDQVARFEIVGPVEDEDGFAEQFFIVRRREVGHDAGDVQARIDARQRLLGRESFGEGRRSVGLIEQPLALEIAGFDEIAIDQSEAAQAGAGQGRGLEAPERSAPDDGDVRVE